MSIFRDATAHALGLANDCQCFKVMFAQCQNSNATPSGFCVCSWFALRGNVLGECDPAFAQVSFVARFHSNHVCSGV